jgi:DNA-directed RNA polymerase specialized sigma24 family protein
MRDDTLRGGGQAPLTRWSLVSRAAHQQTTVKVQALDELLTLYRPVLRIHLIRNLRLPPDRADDIVQSFLAEKVLAKNVLAKADRRKGRFRSFLLKVFTNYVFSALRRDQAQKRGPTDSQMVNLDEAPDLASSAPEIYQAFNVSWARQILSEVIQRMRRECAAKGRDDLWQVFECRILAPTLDQAPAPAYEALVTQFGFQSPAQASNLLITAKRMFQRILKEVVRDTVTDEADVAAEIRDMARILAGATQDRG